MAVLTAGDAVVPVRIEVATEMQMSAIGRICKPRLPIPIDMHDFPPDAGN